MSAAITVVGLGSGNPDRLTLGILKTMQRASRVYVRTLSHPVMAALEELQVKLESFDHVYETHDTFPEVYESIASQLINLAKAGEAGSEVVYAVPGHPMVAEATVRLLRERCPKEQVALTVLGGESFLDEAFVRLGFDPIEGFQLLDAAELNSHMVQPQLHTLIGQVYDMFTASEVKLALMEIYPDDYPVIVGHALGVEGEECIQQVPLYDLDRIDGYGNLSLVYVPRSDDAGLRQRSFARLHEIVGILRSPEGCPWDREQTHESIRKNLIEETYEVLETIDEDDPEHMEEELGDLLLQIMLHAQMEEELGTFTVYDVIQSLNDKLIFRHPHVFGDRSANDAESALQNWEQMKQEEKRRKGQNPQEASALAGIPRDLPALMKAYKLQKKAAKVGFDWEDIHGVFLKIEEELAELRAAVAEGEAAEAQALELGDLLFAVCNAARFIGADPEEALSRTNRKFIQRFHYIEEQLAARNRSVKDSTLEEMEALWQEAKSKAGEDGDIPGEHL
ncbi:MULTISPECIES: nucleoside triphosphate pyrophosphohydrolase [Paenibacillus]|uniref:Nucleoside triphosphate pyrophosphohydrolase n=1 Tax=Paenibacillus campinasensis TaxID=66347 RepID=A0A268EGH3_9BACL|nr:MULTISPECIES: nucleoside triphosphate pyrophosphohydrolase [Paenibacillus]PAD72231.1 nucleoside triphosphate pyrophosphohydrolase [Paenibacillus campinasensis]PAK48761.1 nucleoside triphosphate pyrophosphohydrolase [Paenibacillus sp. 7541]